VTVQPSAPTEGVPDPVPAGREPRGLAKAIGPVAANVVEWLVVIAGAVLLALLIKAFVLQAFFIPSLSMASTLEKGDRVLVNKLSYTFGDVDRGDIVVFERPPTETAGDIPDLIKRVVGLPGESIVIKDDIVYVDGRALDEPYLDDAVITSTASTPLKCSDTEPCVVPPDYVWVMGDNRPDSKDSRFFGAIPESSIVGRSFVRIWPLDRLGML
jgi:signal peptidase I